MDAVFWSLFLIVACEVKPEGISSKLDFSESTSGNIDSSKVSGADGDVEVQHTIVVSTKLKNSGLHSTSAADDVKLIRPQARKQKDQRSNKDDSGEVPVVNGYLAVESTLIRAPDTRNRALPQPESVFLNYNINPDGFDVYPENAADIRHWRPSNFYNNINYKSFEPDHLVTYNLPNNNNRRNRPKKPGFHGTVTEDGLKDYYCCKCKEMNGAIKTTPRSKVFPWSYETTPKVKLDEDASGNTMVES